VSAPRRGALAAVGALMVGVLNLAHVKAPRELGQRGPSKKGMRRLAQGIGSRLTAFMAGEGTCQRKGCTKPISVDHDGTCVRFCSRACRKLRHNRNGLRAMKYAERYRRAA
jgi:hypothetical protein